MQSVLKLSSHTLLLNSSSKLQSATPAGYLCCNAVRGYADDIKVVSSRIRIQYRQQDHCSHFILMQKVGKDNTNWISDGVQATVGAITKVLLLRLRG